MSIGLVVGLLFWPFIIACVWVLYKTVRLYRRGEVLHAVFWLCAFIAIFQVWSRVFLG